MASGRDAARTSLAHASILSRMAPKSPPARVGYQSEARRGTTRTVSKRRERSRDSAMPAYLDAEERKPGMMSAGPARSSPADEDPGLAFAEDARKTREGRARG